MRAQFATTRWSVVLAAGGRAAPQSDAALATLCEAYWYPVYAYLRRDGRSVEDAQDLTQAFFARLLEKNWVEAATPERGRFRSFLLASVKHFVANERDRARALKRGGALPALPLETGEFRYRHEPQDNTTPETLYHREWAQTVFDRVLTRLQSELATAAKSHLFDALHPYITNDDDAGSYRDAATPLGMSEGAVRVTVHRLRRRFRDLLRAEVAESVTAEHGVEDEVQFLRTALK
jgi:RNA polymerase sigma factor (sigma-70 family)